MKQSVVILAFIASLTFAQAAPPNPAGTNPTGQNASVFKPVTKEEDLAKKALLQVQTALNTCERSFTPQNLRAALEITAKADIPDKTIPNKPWIDFCKKHKSRVFMAISSGNPTAEDVQRLADVTTWCLKNGLNIEPLSERKVFEQNVLDTQMLAQAASQTPQKPNRNPR